MWLKVKAARNTRYKGEYSLSDFAALLIFRHGSEEGIRQISFFPFLRLYYNLSVENEETKKWM